MDYTIKCHDNSDYVEYITSGNFCVDSEEKGVASLVSRPEWKSGCRLLADHSQSPASHLSVVEINEIAKITTLYFKNSSPSKLAIIVGDTLTYGQATLWNVLASDKFPINNKIFFDRDEALQWLLRTS